MNKIRFQGNEYNLDKILVLADTRTSVDEADILSSESDDSLAVEIIGEAPRRTVVLPYAGKYVVLMGSVTGKEKVALISKFQLKKCLLVSETPDVLQEEPRPVARTVIDTRTTSYSGAGAGSYGRLRR